MPYFYQYYQLKVQSIWNYKSTEYMLQPFKDYSSVETLWTLHGCLRTVQHWQPLLWHLICLWHRWSMAGAATSVVCRSSVLSQVMILSPGASVTWVRKESHYVMHLVHVFPEHSLQIPDMQNKPLSPLWKCLLSPDTCVSVAWGGEEEGRKRA